MTFLSFLVVGCTEEPIPTQAELRSALSLEIVPSKDSDYVVEPDHRVNVKIVFKNHSNYNFWLNSAFNFSRCLCELTFEIVLPSGKTLPEPGFRTDPRRGDLGKKDFEKIRKMGTYEKIENIYFHYDLSKEEGIHTITAIYKNEHDGKAFGVNTWRGTIRSEPIKINILKK